MQKPVFLSKINFDIFLSQKMLYVIVGAIVSGYLATLWNRYIYIDDAWFGEQAYWFAKDCIPRAETLKGYYGWDEHLLVYHRFNIIWGAMLIKIFGWSVENFRIATLLVMILFFFILYRYSVMNSEKYGNRVFIIWFAFIFANPLMISLSFTYRPEILIMFFGFLSWIFIEKACDQNVRWYFPLLGGGFAGMAFFTHLNGLIFPLSGFILLIINRKPKALILFCIAATVTSSFFFYDLWQEGRLEIFIFQMKNWPDPVGASYLGQGVKNWFWKAFVKLSVEHQRFFWSYKVWMVSSMFLISLLVFFKTIYRSHRNLVLFTLSLILSLNIFGSQIAERFVIYLLPYMAIIVGAGIHSAIQKKNRIIISIYSTMVLFQIIFCFTMIFSIISKNRDYVAIHTRILDHIPEKNALTLVDYPFVFNGLESHRLITFKLFEYLEVSGNLKFNINTFTSKASELGVKYIILPIKPDYIENTNFTPLFNGIKDIPFYEKYLEPDGYLILRHKPEK